MIVLAPAKPADAETVRILHAAIERLPADRPRSLAAGRIDPCEYALSTRSGGGGL